MFDKKKIFKYSLSSLNSQLFFFVILPISILLIAITFGSLALHQEAMRDLVATRDQRTVNSAARALGEQLDHRLSMIQSIATHLTEGSSQDEFFSTVDFLLDDYDAGLAVLSPAGDLIVYSGDIQTWEKLKDDVSPLIFRAGPDNQELPQISEPFYNEQLNDIFSLVIYRSDINSPTIIGIFSVTKLARENLSGILSYDNQGSVILADQNNYLLYKTGLQEIPGNLSVFPGVAEALRGETGTTYLNAEDGEHVIVFSPVSPTNWALVIDEPWKEIASPLLRYSESGSLILLPIVVFALIALWFGTIKIIQPLRAFQDQAELFTQGNYQAFNDPVGGIEEIQILQTTFIDMAEEVENAQQVLTGYLNIVTKGQEEERKRLARELHDDTLQSLIALNQRIMLARRQADHDDMKGALTEIETMLAKTMQELRRLTRALRPIYLEDLGLVPALESLALETSESLNIPIVFRSEGAERRLADNIEIALYRISQEAISNISRHSQASKADLSITFNDADLKLEITDNGIGFDPPKNPGDFAQMGHYGLLGIHERTVLIKASFQIRSEPGNGTAIVIQAPY